MTNREWLKSLDNEELASILADFAKAYNNDDTRYCDYCFTKPCTLGCCCGGDRADSIYRWLKAEHKEEL